LFIFVQNSHALLVMVQKGNTVKLTGMFRRVIFWQIYKITRKICVEVMYCVI